MDKDITKYLKYYLGCECEVDLRLYVNDGKGLKYNTAKVPAIFDSINRNRSFDQCWGITVNDPEGFEFVDDFNKNSRVYTYFVHSNAFKLRLRKLESMTEDEGVELAKIHKYDIPEDEGVRQELISIYTFDDGVLRIGTTYLPGKLFIDGFHYLLSRGFWLFGDDWFEEGFIINKEQR